MSTYIKPSLFAFFRDLKSNNDRDWFQANKERYESQVREPLLRFIRDFGDDVLPQLSSHFVADARKTGGSLFRIHRDVRFSADKSPYKTAAGVHFRHERAKDAHAPGFYLHLEPGDVFVGVGIWHPDNETLARIRERVAADDGTAWKKVTSGKQFASTFDLAGESLKRPPRGYDPDHPCIEDLKRKDFIGVTELRQKQTYRDNFLELFGDHCRRALPFMRFLAEALDLPL